MKYASLFGIIAAVLLIICCFFPWAYYPDIQQDFNGFYSMQNQYGKPGKTYIVLTVVSTLLFIIPRIWAKRVNQLVSILIFAYAVKNYFIFAACYRGICPVVHAALYGTLIFALGILICSLFSRIELNEKLN